MDAVTLLSHFAFRPVSLYRKRSVGNYIVTVTYFPGYMFGMFYLIVL